MSFPPNQRECGIMSIGLSLTVPFLRKLCGNSVVCTGVFVFISLSSHDIYWMYHDIFCELKIIILITLGNCRLSK